MPWGSCLIIIILNIIYIPPSALPSPFAPALDRFGRFLTLGKSAFAVGGVDDAELDIGAAADAAGAGEQ